MRTNLERALSGLAVLRAYRETVSVDPDEADLSDVLADLMHLARLSQSRAKHLRAELEEYDAQRWDFDRELDRARSNHNAEAHAPNWQVVYSGT